MMTLLGQHGQQQDFARGIQLIRQAALTADENAPQGAYVLGMLQARELPQISVPEVYLPYDEKSARQNIEKAAYLSFAKAQLKMGSAYELCSLGCEFNPTLSLHYNALASRQGEPEADMAISKWFLCGHPGEFAKNEELAYQYAQRAAVAGLATAEFAMGYFNEIGMHIPVNIDKAIEWYEKAEKNGNKDAATRIESISKTHRTLSKKDHEKVAIGMIKSKHGSMRGQRPARLQKPAAPLPAINDNSPSDYGSDASPITTAPGRMGNRADTTTPYPMSDRPPVLGNPPSSAPYDRPGTVTPYPMDNGPPRLGQQRPGIAGGFAPELRASSTRPTSAFNINPNVYPANDGYGRGGPRPGPGPDMGSLPFRPHTSVDNMGPGTGRGRVPSGGRGGPLPPNGPGSYRQPGGPSAQYPEQQPRPQTAQPIDAGFGAPDGGRNKLQKVGMPLKKQPTLPDIGYVAPLEPRQHTRPSTVQPGQESRTSSRPDRPSTAGPGQGPHPSSRPSSAGRPSAHDGMPKPHRVATIQQQQQPSKPMKQAPAQASKPSTPAPPSKPSTPASSASGNGPKTFDEMGIGSAPKDSDCVSRSRAICLNCSLTIDRLSCNAVKHNFQVALHIGLTCIAICTWKCGIISTFPCIPVMVLIRGLELFCGTAA
jgi:hypothetical protein